MTLLRPALAKSVNSLLSRGGGEGEWVEYIQEITKRGERGQRGKGDGKTPSAIRVQLTPPAVL